MAFSRTRSGIDRGPIRREGRRRAIWTPAAQPSVRAVRSSTSVSFSSIPNSSMTAATSASRESEFGVAHLEQLAMRTKSVQRELGLSSAAHDHTTAGREALDERGQAGCRGRGELEVVDHDHDRFTERREVVHDRDRDVAEVGFRLARASRSRRASGRATGEQARRSARTKRWQDRHRARRTKARSTRARDDRAARMRAPRSCLPRARRRRASAGPAHLRRGPHAGDGAERASSQARAAKTSSRPGVAESGSRSFVRRSPPIG